MMMTTLEFRHEYQCFLVRSWLFLSAAMLIVGALGCRDATSPGDGGADGGAHVGANGGAGGGGNDGAGGGGNGEAGGGGDGGAGGNGGAVGGGDGGTHGGANSGAGGGGNDGAGGGGNGGAGGGAAGGGGNGGAGGGGNGGAGGGGGGPPGITSISPALGDILGEVSLTVVGSDLDGASVTIGGEPCDGVTTVDANTLGCVAPALSAGSHDVVVTTPGGSAILASGYEAWSPELIPAARVYKGNAGTTTEATSRHYLWEQPTRTAPWHVRDGAGLLWLKDKLWLLGGWYKPAVSEWDGMITTNEVWSSPDLGRTWQLELADLTAPPTTGPGARWTRRHTAGWLTHQIGAVTYLYVVGGDAFNVTSDVWRSADGVTWEQVTATAPWAGRVMQMAASYAGDLYLMGGQTNLSDPSTALQDVWKSTDGGATWSQLPDAPWAKRGMVYTLVEYQGKLWLCGGGTYNDAGPRTYYNDVWSFDGTSWTEVLPNGAAPWMGREFHNQFVYDGELWVSGGWGSDEANHNDFWHSLDGVTWTELTPTPPVRKGHADGIATTPFGVVHATGNGMDTFVYQLVGWDAAPLSEWADQGSGAVTLSQASAPARPLFVADAFGPGADGVWFDGVNAYLTLAAPDKQPSGRSVFWVGRTWKESTWYNTVNASQTVVGDTQGACRSQAGYSADQAALVVTDASGSWSQGHVLRGTEQNDGQSRLIGFTQAVDGAVTAYIDGQQAGLPASAAYDTTGMAWSAVGCGYNTGSRAQAMLGFVVVAPSVLAAQDIQKLATFARKWGVNE